MKTRAGALACALLVTAPAALADAPAAPRAAPDASRGAPRAEGLAQPVIELGAPGRAVVFGERVAFDGGAEGLAWPALARAYEARAKAGERAVVAAPRNARVLDVLRAVWTLREVDVEVQTLGPGNEVRPLVLAKKPAARPTAPTCHAAFFVAPDGALRAAVPGTGSVRVKDVDELARAVARGARACDVRWLAFGGETSTMAWGWVYDVAISVQAIDVAPNARFVLGEPLKSAAR